MRSFSAPTVLFKGLLGTWKPCCINLWQVACVFSPCDWGDLLGRPHLCHGWIFCPLTSVGSWIFPLNLLDHVDRMQNDEIILGFMFQWSWRCCVHDNYRGAVPENCIVSLQKVSKTLKLLKLTVFIWKNLTRRPRPRTSMIWNRRHWHTLEGVSLNWWLVDFSFKNKMYWGILGKWLQKNGKLLFQEVWFGGV